MYPPTTLATRWHRIPNYIRFIASRGATVAAYHPPTIPPRTNYPPPWRLQHQFIVLSLRILHRFAYAKHTHQSTFITC